MERYDYFAAVKVSIHTPTQGVTVSINTGNRLHRVSIHTPTQGVTSRSERNTNRISFNPHTHAGCDLDAILQGLICMLGFNPHTHAGCDDYCLYLHASLHVSIHTPTQGVTSNRTVGIPLKKVSIHTPTQGVTRKKGYVKRIYLRFQSTHPRRV